jgi:hypothetical protein
MAGLPWLPPNPLGLPQAPMAGGMPFPDVPQPPHLEAGSQSHGSS